MRKYTLLIALLFSLAGFSQSSHFALNMGAAIPFGDFASNGDYLSNGYAKTGFNLSFEGNYIPTWYFGVGGSLSFSNFNMDQDKMLVDYLEFIDAEFPELPDNTEVRIGVGHWNYINILIGPTLALPTDFVQFNIKALFGPSVIVPPGGSIEFINGDQRYYTCSTKQTVGFGYQFGTDIIYTMQGNYSLMLGASYFGTRAKYDTSTDFAEQVSGGTDATTSEKDVKIHAVQVTLGLAFLF